MNKQHIVGLIIFTLIVGTSVVIASFFIKIPEIKSVTVSDYDGYTYKSERKCRKKRKKRKKPRGEEVVNIKLNQAVFNVKTNKLTLDLTLLESDKSDQSSRIAFHFFVNDRYGTRHLATEQASVSFSNGGAINEMISLNWLKNLQSHENLYVIPQTGGEYSDVSAYRPVFDNSKATAILLRGTDRQ